MAASISTLDDKTLQRSLAAERFSLLGCALDVASQCPRYREASFGEVSNMISCAIMNQQMKCYFNTMGRPVGLLLWAWVTEDVLTRLTNEATFPPSLHQSEWQEGKIPFVVDLVSLPHTYTFKAMVADAKNFFRSERRLAWINWQTRRLRSLQR